jgi:hypothetical protein
MLQEHHILSQKQDTQNVTGAPHSQPEGTQNVTGAPHSQPEARHIESGLLMPGNYSQPVNT